MSATSQIYFVHVTPHPVFARLERLHDGMVRRVKVLGGVLVLGRVAAPYVAAGEAPAQMDPGVAHFETLFATRGAGFDSMDIFQVSATRHPFPSGGDDRLLF
jgi:hypothetical protein